MTIGIAGTLGAGKGTVVEYFVQTKGFVHYSVREFLWQEVDRRSLPRVRENLGLVANDWRAQHGSSYIVEQLYERAQMEPNRSVIIESLHTVGEAEFLKSKGAIIFGVDADIALRYERIVKRSTETDYVSYKKFVEDNNREIADTDPARHNIRKVIDIADYKIMNDGTVEELHAQIDEVLKQITK